MNRPKRDDVFDRLLHFEVIDGAHFLSHDMNSRNPKESPFNPCNILQNVASALCLFYYISKPVSIENKRRFQGANSRNIRGTFYRHLEPYGIIS